MHKPKKIESESIEKAVKALQECADVWFYEIGTYEMTHEYFNEKSKLISIMKNMIEEAEGKG